MTSPVSGVRDGTIRVEVADVGGPSVPVLRGEPDGALVTWFEVPPVAAGTPDTLRRC